MWSLIFGLQTIQITHEHCLDGTTYWNTRARTYMAKYQKDLSDRADHGVKRNISEGNIVLTFW